MSGFVFWSGGKGAAPSCGGVEGYRPSCLFIMARKEEGL